MEIIADMLAVIDGRAKKTHIMYQANLSYVLLEKYLKEIRRALLCRLVHGDNCYELTPRGEEFLGRSKEYVKVNKHLEKWAQDADGHRKALEAFFAAE